MIIIIHYNWDHYSIKVFYRNTFGTQIENIIFFQHTFMSRKHFIKETSHFEFL